MNAEPIASVAVGYYMLWVFGTWFQFFTQLSDHNPQVFEVSAAVPAPDRAGEFLIAHRFVGALEKILEYIELFRSKVSCKVPGARYLMRMQIDHAPGQHDLRFSQTGVGNPTQESSHAGKELLGLEWRDHVVVCSRLQRIDLRLTVVVLDQENDTEVGLRPDCAAKIVPAHTRQIGGDNQHVMQAGGGFQNCLSRTAHCRHPMSGQLQKWPQLRKPCV